MGSRPNSELREHARAFFDEFVEAFRTFDGAVIAQRYRVPYLAMRADGGVGLFETADRVAEYFQKVVDGYHSRGCRSCRYRDLEVVPIGDTNALLTVTWELVHENQSILSCWRESYNVHGRGSDMRVFASVDHAA